jgi:hypothetical protein
VPTDGVALCALQVLFGMCTIANKCTSDTDELERDHIADVLEMRVWRQVVVYNEEGLFKGLGNRQYICSEAWECEAALFRVLCILEDTTFVLSASGLERVIAEFRELAHPTARPCAEVHVA